MAVKSNLDTRTYEAGSDLSAAQYHFVTLATDGQIDLTGDGLQATGVLQNDPDAAGKAATVAVGGRTKIVVGTAGALAVGDQVSCDANGEAEAGTTGTGVVMGTCVQAAGVGEIAAMELTTAYVGSL